MNKFLENVRNRPELLILALVIMIIAMLIIPLPTYLVDFLIGLNIVISLLVFMGSFYIDRILNFSTFPAVLLITTLFRLALSISTSRLILNDADAGEIVRTFGLFVIGDNLVVGFVIFGIVTIVQFIVITKGAERVAEVAARFSLDAMPGKQMSIDADLKAGVIDSDAAKERRSVLEKESQLYGSFDGAMKFIKGDAIAGIIVIFINFIGGISVGVSQHGMSMSSALSTYTMLTIGDGLVAQIPSLLIAISAGFIVTRVNGDGDNMGRTMMSQLVSNPFALMVTAGLALTIGFLPGFPLFVFVILAGVLSGFFIYKHFFEKKKGTEALEKADSKEEDSVFNETHSIDSSLGLIGNLDKVSSETVPFIMLVSSSDLEKLENQKLVEHLRSQFFIDYGIRLPNILLRASTTVSKNRAVFLINEIRAEEFVLQLNLLRIVNSSDELMQLEIETVLDNGTVWVKPEHKETLENMGYQLRSPIDELYHSMAALLSRHVSEYFGIQETKDMLDKLENKYPDLMKEIMRHATIQRITEVLQRLLSERISVRNMRLIMESLALWMPREKDVISLVEHVRGGLSRYICHKFSVNNELRSIVLSSEVEDMIRQGIRNTSGGTFLNLEPAVSDQLMDLFSVNLENLLIDHKDLVLLSSVDTRRFVKKFIESRFRDLEVMSFGEISETVSVNVLKTI
ncbi:EscV/YscV/HrcV family type III secretion system export apparatus protein [Candidatus Hamiltonella defensa]|uniref:EscV/YscV/HrcV family type III secretion system export apparatus protein n=1 Tax=Candidatus Williamhamiltonella defendens TaxID=138072 RepID=A0A2D3TD37_9ENTR|nr:EscV/YscV/HrcV family type III secretion system export apparatus protein [Candidatus Hamiltonella defensa]ATW33740.1 EscV/YscV/HrcV family type III secretion system export apparatus protein [Candidatus Hamiltonella defensa]AYB48229.1 EscV/YscV/HrcV family type III secretion system export apparatus protein [Candidatus Hamiltonella defensa]MBK4362163.1 EscV/YscV/HrcV family type III secretion system export apparatus protein [Candidatus Hamiltonella defensa]